MHVKDEPWCAGVVVGASWPRVQLTTEVVRQVMRPRRAEDATDAVLRATVDVGVEDGVDSSPLRAGLPAAERVVECVR